MKKFLMGIVIIMVVTGLGMYFQDNIKCPEDWPIAAVAVGGKYRKFALNGTYKHLVYRPFHDDERLVYSGYYLPDGKTFRVIYYKYENNQTRDLYTCSIRDYENGKLVFSMDQ